MSTTHKTECSCDCHVGAAISHWQLGQTVKYDPAKCHCSIPGNRNFVPDEIRKTWE